jgi:hypothetical protein
MAGEAECQFNTNVWLRGRLVGVNGDFSGTFSALNVDVAGALNIRNGAVSAYTSYSATAYPSLQKGMMKTLEFTVQQQPFNSIIDITIPMTCEVYYYRCEFPAKIRWYRNNVLVKEDDINDLYTRGLGGNQYNHRISFASVRLIDFDVPADAVVTYRVEIIDYYLYARGMGTIPLPGNPGGYSGYYTYNGDGFTSDAAYWNNLRNPSYPDTQYWYGEQGSGGVGAGYAINSNHIVETSTNKFSTQAMIKPNIRLYFKGKALIGIRKR